MKPIICPCDNCVCIPMCKFKIYTELYWGCRLIRDYISEYLLASADDGSDPSPFTIIYNTIKPTEWIVKDDNVNIPTSVDKRQYYYD